MAKWQAHITTPDNASPRFPVFHAANFAAARNVVQCDLKGDEFFYELVNITALPHFEIVERAA